MHKFSSKKTVSKGDVGDFTNTRTHNTAIDPALSHIQNKVTTGLQNPQGAQITPAALSRTRQERQRESEELSSNLDHRQESHFDLLCPSQILPSQSISEYPDPGLIDHGFSRSRVLPAVESGAAPEAQTKASHAVTKRTDKRVAPSLRKRTRAEAGLSADVEDGFEDGFEDAAVESRRSTRRSKRTKVLPENDDSGDESEKRKRKISKLRIKIAEGKAPKKGSLGPKGEVRIREDGRMEFRDVDNPEWTLAAYHSEYRRLFIDEAARNGEFDNPPAQGEAYNDETSFEEQQKSWGPSRADWQNITNSEGRKVMFDINKPESRRPPQEPSNWIHDGLVLLDSKNHPVKDWPGLNKTLSTEIESWRWEAIMRINPWLTVADLLARMPHTRERKGEILPLQTPAAFTNRAHRFRVPNQIPASHPKNGSKAYKEEILKNLAKDNAMTTEELTVLDHDQVAKVRKTNKGKFMRNSRYTVPGDEDVAETPAPPKKRKARCDDDTESRLEQAAPEAKKQRIQAPECGREEISNLDWKPLHNPPTTTPNAYSDDTAFYNGLLDTTGPVINQTQEDLVPLFASIDDRDLALIEDATFTSAYAVMQARRNGHQRTRQIGVYYYGQSTPRYIELDGSMVDDVAHFAFRDTYMAAEPVPEDIQPAWPFGDINDTAPPFTQSDTQSNAQSSFSAVFNPWLNATSNESFQPFVQQTTNVAPAMTIQNLQPPLPLANQIGRYQAESDIFGEVWRNHHGSTGF